MTTDSSGVRLGDLLTGAGLLQASDLREAMLISKQQGLPVGRVLIMSGFLTEAHLQAAVQAQSLLKDGLIDFDTVIKALSMVGSEEVSLDDAFRKLKWNQQSDAITNKLGELLMAADIVPIDALNSALLQCQSIGLPLGRVLVASGVLSEQMLAAALNAQVFVRDKKLNRDQAISSLRSARDRQIPIEQYLAETGMQLPTADTVRLGELFVLAKVIDEPSLMGAVEMGLINEKPVGQVLLESKLVTEELLNSALELQRMVAAGAIKKSEAGMFLMTVQKKSVSVQEAIKSAQPVAIPSPAALSVAPEGLPLYQFLQVSGIITSKQIEQAIRIGSKDSEIMGKMLLMAGILEPELIKAAQQCNELIGTGVLTTEQGMIALKNCERNNFALEHAFAELGWDTSPLKAFGGLEMAPTSRPFPIESFETKTLEAVPALMPSAANMQSGQHPAIQAAEAQQQQAANLPVGSLTPAVSAQPAEGSLFGRQPTDWQQQQISGTFAASEPSAAPSAPPPQPPTPPPQLPTPPPEPTPIEAPPYDPFQDQFGGPPAAAVAAAATAAETPPLFGSFTTSAAVEQTQQMFTRPSEQSPAANPEGHQVTAGGAPGPGPTTTQDLVADAQWGNPDSWATPAQTTPQPQAPMWGNSPAETSTQAPAATEQPPNWAQPPSAQPQSPSTQPAQPGQPGTSWGDSGPSGAWQASSGQTAQWQQAPNVTGQNMPAAPPPDPIPLVPPAQQNWNFDQPTPPANWQPITQIQSPAAAETAAPSGNPWGTTEPTPAPPTTPTTPASTVYSYGSEPTPATPYSYGSEPAPGPTNPAPPPQPQQWPTAPQPAAPPAEQWAPQPTAQPQPPPAQPAYQQPAANGAWQNQPSNQLGAWQQPMPPQEGWQSSSQNQQSANQQPDWQQQQAAAPPDPWQIAGQAQQGDAWQQAGQGQRDSWQSLPQQQAGVSSAAQMFQEAAQSLQDQTPGTQPQPPQQPQPAPRPAEEQTTQGGHMDLFSDSDQPEEQDKPKKRLSDLMPKLGPKT